MNLKKNAKRLSGALVLGALLLAIAWAGGGSPGGAPTAFATVPCPDVDGDGVVTIADVDVVAASILKVPPLPIQADANADGAVTVPGDVLFVTLSVGLVTPCQVKPYIDTDLDGCTDIEERGPPAAGGGRSPSNFWDFYDTPDAAGVKDLTVTILDIMRVAARFGSAGPVAPPGSALPGDPLLLPIPPPPAYHSSYDRTAGPGPFLTAIANGGISVPVDILRVAAQFGHSCVAAP